MALSEVITNYKSRRPQLEAILKTEDREGLEADLKAFFGKNEGPYLQHVAELGERNKLFLARWHWPAFLTLGYGWAFFRRLYPLGLALFAAHVVMVLVATNPRMVGIALFLLVIYLTGLILFALYARSLYVGFALNAIARANERRIVAHKRPEYIAKLGGVSLASGAGGIALLILCVVLTVTMSQPPV